MNPLEQFQLGAKLSLLILLSLGDIPRCIDAVAESTGPKSSASQKQILERFRKLSKTEMDRSKTLGAQRLTSNLIPVLNALSRDPHKGVPTNVKLSAASAVRALRAGTFIQPLAKSLSRIMAANYEGNTAKQLERILRAVTPNAAAGSRGALKNLTDFLSTNLNGVNNLLSSVVAGTPDLLKGVVPALLGPLGAVNETLLGTVDSLGVLLSGLLA